MYVNIIIADEMHYTNMYGMELHIFLFVFLLGQFGWLCVEFSIIYVFGHECVYEGLCACGFVYHVSVCCMLCAMKTNHRT